MVLEDLKDGFKNPKIKSLARLRFAVRMFFWISLTVSLTLYFLGHFVVLDFYIFCLCFSVMDHPLTLMLEKPVCLILFLVNQSNLLGI